jgi:hypothetical protein
LNTNDQGNEVRIYNQKSILNQSKNTGGIPASVNIINAWGSMISSGEQFSNYEKLSKSGKYQFPFFTPKFTNENCDSTGCTCRGQKKVYNSNNNYNT